MRAACIALALLALPAAASAQPGPPSGTTKPAPPIGSHPAKPKPKPTTPGHGGPGHGGYGSYRTNVIVDPKDDIASPKPHVSNPPSTFTSTAGQETFGSVSTGR